MLNIDKIDRKILYQLDLNSRQPFSQIGKKISQPKANVSYRVQRLKLQGIIKKFYTVIDAFKLGYISFRIYLTFENINKDIKCEIIKYFVDNKYTWWVGKTEGRFDIVVVMWVKNINEFYVFWEKTLQNYRKYFEKQVFSIYTQLLHYRYSFLWEGHPIEDRNTYEITGGGNQVEYDEMDMGILRLLAGNSRVDISEMANKLHVSSKTIRKRMKQLAAIGVILGYRIQIDYAKLGYVYYKLDLDLVDYAQRNKIISYIKYCPYLIFIDKSAGFADIELELYVKDLDQLIEIVNDIIEKFPEIIKNYKYFYLKEIYKVRYIPEK